MNAFCLFTGLDCHPWEKGDERHLNLYESKRTVVIGVPVKWKVMHLSYLSFSFLLNRLQCNRIDSLSVLVLAVLVDGLRIPFDEARKGLKP